MSAPSRHVGPEILDDLDPSDPFAIGSRRDLRRLNIVMRNAGNVARRLKAWPRTRVMEIGAGDGSFAWEVVRRLPQGAQGSIALLDRQLATDPTILARFVDHGLSPDILTADVFDELTRETVGRFDAIWANLFLHHFEEPSLRRLLGLIAMHTDRFVACEPHRSRVALGSCRLLPFLGCNRVTRHDARVSVAAGFRERELSALWPQSEDWTLTERPIPPFGHLFVAERRN